MHPDHAPSAAFNLGNLLARQGDMDGARAAHEQTAACEHDDAAPMAAFNLGSLLADQGDLDGACASYRQAVDSGHPDQAPGAAFHLGNLLARQGDVDGARAPPTIWPSIPGTARKFLAPQSHSETCSQGTET